MVKYSICITHRNNVNTVKESLGSILSQLNQDFEVIVVDSKSTDGSLDILRRYSEEGRIKLLEQRCSRGKGRQIALEHANGDIILSNLDTDEVYSPHFNSLLEIYKQSGHRKVLLAISGIRKGERERQNITIAPRDFLEMIGGWRDVNYGEDWDLWKRAAEHDRFVVIAFPLVSGSDPSVNRHGLRLRFTRYISMIQLGRPTFANEKRVSLSRRLIYLAARGAALFKPRFPGTLDFDPYDSKYLITPPINLAPS